MVVVSDGLHLWESDNKSDTPTSNGAGASRGGCVGGRRYDFMTMTCDETTGLVSAALAAICFGSHGVPMKGEAATAVDVDPLVFQSYKAFAVLVSVPAVFAVSFCRLGTLINPL